MDKSNKTKTYLYITFAIAIAISISLIIVKYTVEIERAVQLAFDILTLIFSIVSAASITCTFNINIIAAIRTEIKDNDKSVIVNGKGNEVNLLCCESYDLVNQNNQNAIMALKDTIQNFNDTVKDNINNVASIVANKVSQEKADLKVPSSDFLFKYFEEARKISDKDIQEVWASLFINEARNPNSISLRVLDILKNITHDELIFCNKMFNEVVVGRMYIPNALKDKFLFYQYSSLSDIGLIKSEFELKLSHVLNPREGYIIKNNHIFYNIVNNSNVKLTLNLSGMFLTDAGVVLANALNTDINDKNFELYINSLTKEYPQTIFYRNER